MSWSWAKYLILWVLVVTVFQAQHLESCMEERLGLLQIKEFLRSINPQSFGLVRPWLDNGETRNCCAWEMVRCDSATKRVTELYLGSMVSIDHGWLFNVTLFRPFAQLIGLDLSSNSISGLIEDDGSTRISTLKNLQFLKLDNNRLQDSYVSMAALESLKRLTLQSCCMTSFISTRELANLTELQVLDLSSNTNNVQGPIRDIFENMRGLQFLDMSFTFGIRGSMEGICNLKNLQEFRIPRSGLDGSIPSCLHNLTSLKVLDLSENELSGKFPNVLPNLTSLEYFSISYNHLEGQLSLSSLANHSKLQHLLLSSNLLQVQTEDSIWQPSFQLQTLALDNCSLNKPHGTVPKFLSQQYNLTAVDLSHNNLVGAFPTWLVNNNSKLRTLYLTNNRLTGSLQFSNDARFSLEALSISANNLQGELPTSISLVFPAIGYLNMSINNFTGIIPASIGDITGLYVLDLSRNDLTGTLPRNLLSHQQLELLQLSDNHLEGDILPEYMSLPKLFWLKLSNNNFSGTIKDSLQKSAVYYNYLDISNKVKGQLPSWIGDLSSLRTLSISGNLLQGPIPEEVCKLGDLTYLDLSRNNFTGPIPTCFNFSYLGYMHLHQNSLTGPIPQALSGCSNLVTLDLRDNQLSGRIPPWINMLSSVTVLLLGRNNLHGQVPQQMCQLEQINILDLSHNRLSGRIPSCFGNLSFGMKATEQFIDGVLLLGDAVAESLRSFPNYPVQDELDLLVKDSYLSYVGGDLLLMSELDLSGNKLSGVIPSELGDLKHIHSLNLSHNHLSGSIPSSFSNLKQIESLDLSCNNLSGVIPPELVDLNYLGTFNVSYNNLTGRTPETGQFADFDQHNYLGNPQLCGLAVNKSCNHPSEVVLPKEDERHGDSVIDMVSFFWSFGTSSVIAFLTTIVVLCINPQLRGALFAFVDRHVLHRQPWC